MLALFMFALFMLRLFVLVRIFVNGGKMRGKLHAAMQLNFKGFNGKMCRLRATEVLRQDHETRISFSCA